MEHALAVALQLGNGNSGDPRQLAQADGLVEMRADVLVHRGEALIGRMRIAGRLQVHRNADQADDFAAATDQWPLVRQAPARLAAAVQMQFQLVLQHLALLQNPSVLLGVAGAESGGKHFGAGLAQQRLQMLQATTLHQRAIGHHVARLDILDEDRGIRNHVQHR
ncbi:hypothetical protein D3C72_1860280 [compost metagenome]